MPKNDYYIMDARAIGNGKIANFEDGNVAEICSTYQGAMKSIYDYSDGYCVVESKTKRILFIKTGK